MGGISYISLWFGLKRQLDCDIVPSLTHETRLGHQDEENIEWIVFAIFPGHNFKSSALMSLLEYL